MSQSRDDVDRITSGIDGLDDLLKGGFPRGSFISVWGFDGYAESIFSKQFCFKGLENNEKVGKEYGLIWNRNGKEARYKSGLN